MNKCIHKRAIQTINSICLFINSIYIPELKEVLFLYQLRGGDRKRFIVVSKKEMETSKYYVVPFCEIIEVSGKLRFVVKTENQYNIENSLVSKIEDNVLREIRKYVGVTK